MFAPIVDVEIGRGGLCVVERTIEPKTRTAVARKRLRACYGGDPIKESMLEAEAAVLRELDHPRIPAWLASGRTDDGLPFLTMTLVEGRELEDVLRDGMEPDDAVAALASACEPVAHAHRRGITHGDLKPGNVMLDRHGAAHVIDWGLARRLGDLDEPELIGGTAGYLSPEEASGRGVDPSTDVYHLGGILCRILTGHPPHAGEWGEVQGRAASGDLEYALQGLSRCGGFAPWIDLAIRALSFDPRDRPDDAGAFGQELEATREQRQRGRWRRLLLMR